MSHAIMHAMMPAHGTAATQERAAKERLASVLRPDVSTNALMMFYAQAIGPTALEAPALVQD